jgi:hypothetical protein
MKAVLGHPRSMRPKVLIAVGCPITAHDVNLGVRTSHGGCGIRKNVENPRVKMMNLPSSVVAEKMVQFSEGLGDIGGPVTVNKIQMLSCMGVVKPEVARWTGRARLGRGELRKNHDQCKNTNAQKRVPLMLLALGALSYFESSSETGLRPVARNHRRRMIPLIESV